MFLTASQGDQLLTIALDAKTGREAWRRQIPRAHTHKIYKSNDPASPSPVADEAGVVVFFADFGLVAYANDGKEAWRHPLGPFRNFYGMAASPIIVGDTVILVSDQTAGSFLLALDRASGRVRWKTERTGRTIGWATPMVFRPAGRPAQLVVLGSTHLDGYDLASGKSLWWMRVASQGGIGMPVESGESVLITTLAATEPWMPEFGAMLEKYDGNKDGRLSTRSSRAIPIWASTSAGSTRTATASSSGASGRRRARWASASSARWRSVRTTRRGSFSPTRSAGAFRRTCRSSRGRWSTRTCSTWCVTAASSPRLTRRRAGC